MLVLALCSHDSCFLGGEVTSTDRYVICLYPSIHDMMAATKINSFESDRCPTITMENGTRLGDKRNLIFTGIGFSKDLTESLCLLRMSSTASTPVNKSGRTCRARREGVHAPVGLFAHVSDPLSVIPFPIKTYFKRH